MAQLAKENIHIAGWKVLNVRERRLGEAIILCERIGDATPCRGTKYVTWIYDIERNGKLLGHYTDDLTDAQLDFAQR